MRSRLGFAVLVAILVLGAPSPARAQDRRDYPSDEDRELCPDEQVRAFMQFAGLDTKDRDLFTAVDEAIHGAIVSRPPATFPHVEDTLRSLSKQGLTIGLISNTGRSWGRYLTEVQNAAGIGQYFQARVYSDQLQVRKPDSRIFEAALDGLRLPASEVVHIGDDVVADVAGAKAVGSDTAGPRAAGLNAAGLNAVGSDTVMRSPPRGTPARLRAPAPG